MITPLHYYATRNKALRLIVIHTMEAPEKPDTAENVAQYFAGDDAPRASAHACVDNDSWVDCLPVTATAWAAPGCNADGYQIEHAGYAAQSASDWQDDYSQSMLKISASHAREIALATGIPLRHLTDDELAAGQAGFIGHDQASRVYKKSDHTDPGTSFPWDQYMALVNESADTTSKTVNASEEEPEMFIIKSPNRPHALIGPGIFRKMHNSEELSVCTSVFSPKVKDKLNDRQYDVAKAAIAGGALNADRISKILSSVQSIEDELTSGQED